MQSYVKEAEYGARTIAAVSSVSEPSAGLHSPSATPGSPVLKGLSPDFDFSITAAGGGVGTGGARSRLGSFSLPASSPQASPRPRSMSAVSGFSSFLSTDSWPVQPSASLAGVGKDTVRSSAAQPQAEDWRTGLHMPEEWRRDYQAAKVHFPL